MSETKAEATARPWTLEIEEYEKDRGQISIKEINRLLHDSGSDWSDPEDWELDLANAELIVKTVNAHESLMAALKGIMEMIESGRLVRNTSDDGSPGFALRQLPLVMALKAASEALKLAGVEERDA